MKALNQKLIDTVRTALKGKRLEKFDASITILQESIAQGGWTKRGSVKYTSGLNGLVSSPLHYDPETECTWCPKTDKIIYTGEDAKKEDAKKLANSIRFFGWDKVDNIEVAYETLKAGKNKYTDKPLRIKVTVEQVKAWVELCAEIRKASALLDAARPLPTITKTTLSPKVQATLLECNLDLDLSTIKMPKLVDHQKEVIEDGEKKIVRWIEIVWEKDIEHRMSRFSHGDCHACGKTIPSRLVVPIEVKDRNHGWVSLWLGRDCASNIFGVKDIGLSKKDLK